MLTFFTTCKGFVEPFDRIQANAIGSWKRLHPNVEILVIGEAEGAERYAEYLDFRYFPDCEHSELGVPRLGDLFDIAEVNAMYGLLCLANSDIVLTRKFTSALRSVAREFERFLMIGQRLDMEIGRLAFEGDWEGRLGELAESEGTLAPPCAVDYFAFTKGVYPEIPPFWYARLAFDNWLVWDALRRGVPVVDATQVVMAAHQPHPKPSRKVSDPEWLHNRRLLADCVGLELSDLGSVPVGFVSHSDWVLTTERLRPR